MNTESREHLSSLMDGEVTQETGRFLVRRLGADAGLRETWARYHLIRDCLRDQQTQFVQVELSQRVHRALSEDQSPAAAGRKPVRTNRWLKPVAGFAVAASVALIAVITVIGGNETELAPPGAGPANQVASESFTSPNIVAATPSSTPVNLSGTSPRDNQRMNAYFLRHYQVTGDAGGRGFVPFVPIVVTQATIEAGEENERARNENASDPR